MSKRNGIEKERRRVSLSTTFGTQFNDFRSILIKVLQVSHDAAIQKKNIAEKRQRIHKTTTSSLNLTTRKFTMDISKVEGFQ